MTIDPSLAKWAQETGNSHLVESSASSLALMTYATRPEAAPVPPDDVLTAWHRALARDRMVALESAAAFVRTAAGAGWSAERICAAVGVDPTVAPDVLVARLSSEAAELHPQNAPGIWGVPPSE